MSIITVNREFGSGGRELAKRLAEGLSLIVGVIFLITKRKKYNY